jgi:hypothetical protein
MPDRSLDDGVGLFQSSIEIERNKTTGGAKAQDIGENVTLFMLEGQSLPVCRSGERFNSLAEAQAGKFHPLEV